jgi:hypothetical protein
MVPQAGVSHAYNAELPWQSLSTVDPQVIAPINEQKPIYWGLRTIVKLLVVICII